MSPDIHQTQRVIAKVIVSMVIIPGFCMVGATSVSSNFISILEECLTLEVIRGMRSMRHESLAKAEQEVVGGFIVPRPQS